MGSEVLDWPRWTSSLLPLGAVESPSSHGSDFPPKCPECPPFLRPPRTHFRRRVVSHWPVGQKTTIFFCCLVSFQCKRRQVRFIQVSSYLMLSVPWSSLVLRWPGALESWEDGCTLNAIQINFVGRQFCLLALEFITFLGALSVPAKPQA